MPTQGPGWNPCATWPGLVLFREMGSGPGADSAHGQPSLCRAVAGSLRASLAGHKMKGHWDKQEHEAWEKRLTLKKKSSSQT